ncbi:Spermidine synthase [Caulifigura coniformis]|uniref:Spermidine synthase n=1 Tax=Caulifigura coniformis TaxID=2527983 RepID=A0A517SB88_9PLAN|nr:hypothetical protein [Caulifigura coniformis]QDT53379.1 Spermidine synthase [Caulifigura coniformis]
MRYGLTFLHRLSSFSAGATAGGLIVGLLSWVWCSQFVIAWGTGLASVTSIGVALVLAASIRLATRGTSGATSPSTWLAIAAWTVASPNVLAFTTGSSGRILDDPFRAFLTTQTAALFFLLPGFSLLLRGMPRSDEGNGAAIRRATVAAGAVWCLAPLTLGVWPGPHAAALGMAALLLARFVRELMSRTEAPVGTSTASVCQGDGLLITACGAATGAGMAIAITQWVQMQLFLPTAALWCATWGGLLLGVGGAMKSRRSGDSLSRAARHFATMALLVGAMAACFALLLRTAMTISGSVSWLPAIVVLRMLIVVALAYLPGRTLGFALSTVAGGATVAACGRPLLVAACFVGAFSAACWRDVTLLSAGPFSLAFGAAAVGLWLLSAGSANVHSRLRWTTLAAASLAVVAACVADPAGSIAAQRALFSGTHFQARALGVPGQLLRSLDDGRLLRSTVTSSGVTAVWSHSGVQWALRENGLTRGVVSTQPDLCPQSVPEVLAAVLPLTMHPQPHHILLMSASYPTVAATCLVFPVESVTAVDDNSAALTFCRESAERIVPSLNKGDNRLVLHHADPIRGLATSDRIYDVIISPDSIVGDLESVRQWTAEHLRMVASHLSAEGVYCQRITCFDLNVHSVLDVVRTAQAVFPVVQLSEVAPGEWLLVGRPTGEAVLDKTFLERLEKPHVRDVLAQAGWDWSIMLSLKTVHPEDLRGAAANASMISGADAGIAYALPMDVMQWGPKLEWRRQWMSRVARPQGDALGEEPALGDVAKRLSDVTLAQQVMIDHPDQFAAYRHFVKKRLQDRPRPKVIQVAGEGLKNGLDPEDARRKAYLAALGRAVESKSREDIDRLTQYFSPFDPLIAPFIPREFVHIDRQSPSPNVAAQWRCGLRSVFYAPPNDCSVTNVCDALELVQTHPEIAGDPEARWDCCNALLEVLKNRWGLRITSGASMKYGVADAHRTLELASSTLDQMDDLQEEAGVTAPDWRTRRMVLEKHLVRPVRSWRSEQAAVFALKASREPQPLTQTVAAETP